MPPHSGAPVVGAGPEAAADQSSVVADQSLAVPAGRKGCGAGATGIASEAQSVTSWAGAGCMGISLGAHWSWLSSLTGAFSIAPCSSFSAYKHSQREVIIMIMIIDTAY